MEVISSRNMGLDPMLVDVLHDLLDVPDESTGTDQQKTQQHAPSRAYLRKARAMAMAATPADMKELPNAYVFVIDMLGLKADQAKVHLEDDNRLVVSGDRKREKEKDQGVKFLSTARRLGRFLEKFKLPKNADTEKISGKYQDGVLTVTVEKKPPPEPKRPKTIEVQVA